MAVLKGSDNEGSLAVGAVIGGTIGGAIMGAGGALMGAGVGIVVADWITSDNKQQDGNDYCEDGGDYSS